MRLSQTTAALRALWSWGPLGASVTVDLTTCFAIPEEYAHSYTLDAGNLIVNEADPTEVGPGAILIEEEDMTLDADLSGTSSDGLEVYGVLNVEKAGTVIDSVTAPQLQLVWARDDSGPRRPASAECRGSGHL